MFSNIYTEQLLSKGWEQSSPMSFTNPTYPGIEFFFDNSDQVEIYLNGKIKQGFYLKTVEDVDKVLANLPS